MKKYSDEIFPSLLQLQAVQNDLPFTPNDVRSYYFGMLKSLLLGYYHNFLSLEMSAAVASNVSVQKALSITPNQLQRITKLFSSALSMSGHISNFNRNLLISKWSAFELLITTLCEKILPQDNQQELLSFEYEEMKKRLKLQEDDAARGKYTQKHLAHVPMPRKYGRLFDVIKRPYSRNLKEDKQFLIFMGDLRNTVHSNFIYYGQEQKTYNFNGINFEFIPNRVVRYNNPDQYGLKLQLDLFQKLCEISLELSLALGIDNEIPYPDLDAQNDIWA
jgi:hypothetical protein